MSEEQVARENHHKRVIKLVDRLEQLILEPKGEVYISDSADPLKPLSKQSKKLRSGSGW